MMSATPARPKRTWRKVASKDVLRGYGDGIGTLLVALIFAALHGAGLIKTEGLATMTLLVLAAVAGVLLRQRYVVEKAKESLDQLPGQLDEATKAVAGQLDEVAKAVAKVERTVDAVTSSAAYDILEHEADWDIVAPDGSLAYGTTRKKLRFNQDNVVTVYELTRSSGGRPGRVEEWTFDPDSIKQVGLVPIGGEDHVLLSLGASYQRDQELTYASTRTIRDLFTDEKNVVSHRVQARTYRLQLRVTWAQDARPKRVRVETIRPDGTSTAEDLQGTELPTAGKRSLVERSYERPPHGQKVIITWWR